MNFKFKRLGNLNIHNHVNSYKKIGFSKLLVTALAISTMALPITSNAAEKTPDFEGTWMLVRAERSLPIDLTPLAKELKESYDFAKDDPALKCIPASWSRVYSNPNTPIVFSQKKNSIEIKYELFDIVRTVPIVDASKVTDGAMKLGDPNYPTLGKNVGWYEGDELVIFSNGYGQDMRVLTTIRQWAGLHQSPLLVTEERYKRTADVIDVEITHFDPLISSKPFTIKYPLDLETEWELAEYGCKPEDAAVNAVN